MTEQRRIWEVCLDQYEQTNVVKTPTGFVACGAYVENNPSGSGITLIVVGHIPVPEDGNFENRETHCFELLTGHDFQNPGAIKYIGTVDLNGNSCPTSHFAHVFEVVHRIELRISGQGSGA